ncbi:MAG: UDP-N-acetylmuramoyl-L-alanine--D-glutamate ligase [Clostridia bacterium]
MEKKSEEFKKNIKGKKIGALGLGRSNIPVIKYLKENGAIITVLDKNKKIENECKKLGVEFILGEKSFENLKIYNYLLRSPGIKPFLSQIEKATQDGVKLTSEIELLMELAPCKIIGVTGSDGKTTTTTLISKFLENAGYRVWLGGNIGFSVFDSIDDMKKEDILVLELSSFQLMTLKQSPDIAVITNISPNHLDYHRSFEEYVMAKENIFKYQKPGSILVLNEDDEMVTRFQKKSKKDVLIRRFSLKKNVENSVYLEENNIISNIDKKIKITNIENVKLVGMHNIANICAAASAVIDLVGVESIRQVITSFTGVEHRMEFIRKKDGVSWYNDSIASSPTRTIAGLLSFNQKVILIAGGYDKNIPYGVIGDYILDKVKVLLLVGSSAPLIKKAVEDAAKRRNIDFSKKVDVLNFNSLEQCVNYANDVAKKDDVIVLSPASAAFDLYKDFEERGNVFKKLVNEL